MTIAIICARGGSRRLPRKNTKLFCGIPLVAWSIIHANCSKLIDHTVLTTDDDELEAIGKEYGAEVIRRPDWPDADKAAANRPFMHAIEILEKKYPAFDTVLTILPTDPCRAPDDFDRGLTRFNHLHLNMLVPVIPQREIVTLKRIHPFRVRTVFFDKSKTYCNGGPGWTIARPRHYIEFSREFSDLDAELDNVFENGLENYPMLEFDCIDVPIWEDHDVDTLEEFELAEVVFKKYVQKGTEGAEAYYDYAAGWKNE